MSTHIDRHEAAPAEVQSAALAALKASLEHAAHLLPAQGPIGVFIHHNTLHAFEHQTFEDGVRSGSAVFGCEPYLSEDRYREELSRGRILSSDLRTVLERDLGARASQSLFGLSSLLDIRLAKLQHPLRQGGATEIEWFMAQTDALRRARQDVSEVDRKHLVNQTRHWVMRRLRANAPGGERPAWADRLFVQFGEKRIEDWSEASWEGFTLSALWEVCLEGVASAQAPKPVPPAPMIRHRDLLHAVAGVDSDLMVNDVLIRVCAGFLDQGIAHWPMPQRDQGLYASFLWLHGQGGGASVWWGRALSAMTADLQRRKLDALSSIQESLEDLGVAPEEHAAYLSATLLALRGWGGMIWHVEQRPDRVHHAIPPGSLIDFVAVRLLLERLALRAAAVDALGYEGELSRLRSHLTERLPAAPPPSRKQTTFLVFQLAQALGWTPEQLFQLDAAQWTTLVDEVESFGELDRRRVFHLAYERRFRVQMLDALAMHRPFDGPSSDAQRPLFQSVFCLDEREESIRRHVEEVAPASRTYAAAGFFGVAMYYRGAAHADFTPLCPVVVRPQHWISERVDPELEELAQRRAGARRRLGMALQSFHAGSRRLAGGALLSTTLGLLATVPLVARVVFPRLTSRFEDYFGRLVAPPPATRLVIERSRPQAAPDDTEGHGFLPEEMIAICERLLRDIGLTGGFARLVFICGHGSTSMNNPHESAHDCGACGGGPGGANARAVAEMLNDRRIRAGVAARGLVIPDDTIFVGGMHNTANDDITLYDTDRVPPSHRAEFDAAAAALHEAAVRNAHERARRFDSAPLALSAQGAKRHMEGRVQDLSQVRPEWGHATNAVCIVGRREKTRGLFLDRRAFLVSYDPTQDDEQSAILSRILGAVIPVCSGINLEYYFCNVDSPGWGSGSKLPHNITGLLGVMDGAMSDLRTGLPWQMVEIHEPMRLLFVIEQSQAALRAILAKDAFFKNMLEHRWIQLACMDPATGALSVYQDGVFEPHRAQADTLPAVPNSQEWYTGWRDYLQFADVAQPVSAAHG